MQIPKHKREVNKKYLAWVRSQPCIICGRLPSDAHHIKSKAAYGSDYTTVCLCRGHHSEVHSLGRDTFQKLHTLSFKDEVIKLLVSYIKRLKGQDDKHTETPRN